MTDVNGVYHSLLQLKSEIDSSLAVIEALVEPPPVSTQQKLSYLINEFSKSIESLRDLSKVLEPKSRMIWDTRATRFSEDLITMRALCDRRMGQWFRSQREQETRDLLFGGSTNKSGDQQGELLVEGRTLQSSHGMLDAITEQSRAILDGIVGQNVTLKSARGKLYDLINSAGVGQSFANSIHSREHADAIIVYACMAFTIAIFVLLWWFVK